MAEFSREAAKTQAVYYLRRVGPDVIKYERQPFNIVSFDDGSGQYIEPFSEGTGLSARTWGDVHSLATAEEILILDTPLSFTGVTEIR
jgi:predicted transcriptional regulator